MFRDNWPTVTNDGTAKYKAYLIFITIYPFQFQLTDKKTPAGLTTRQMLKNGSIIGLIVAVPSLVVFGAMYYFTGDLFAGAIGGAIVHVIAMIFSLKISRRLVKRPDESHHE